MFAESIYRAYFYSGLIFLGRQINTTPTFYWWQQPANKEHKKNKQYTWSIQQGLILLGSGSFNWLLEQVDGWKSQDLIALGMGFIR